jgi:hypothetical protein
MILQQMRTTLLNIEEAYRNEGSTRAAARSKIARALGIGNGTLENLIRERVKKVDADLAAKTLALRLKTIEVQIARLENQRKIALAGYAELDPGRVADLEIGLQKLRALHIQVVSAKDAAR